MPNIAPEYLKHNVVEKVSDGLHMVALRNHLGRTEERLADVVMVTDIGKDASLANAAKEFMGTNKHIRRICLGDNEGFLISGLYVPAFPGDQVPTTYAIPWHETLQRDDLQRKFHNAVGIVGIECKELLNARDFFKYFGFDADGRRAFHFVVTRYVRDPNPTDGMEAKPRFFQTAIFHTIVLPSSNSVAMFQETPKGRQQETLSFAQFAEALRTSIKEGDITHQTSRLEYVTGGQSEHPGHN